MASHESCKPLSDDWHTPPEIIAAFPEFDLDPCCSERQTTRTARRMIHWPTNGLFVSWEGTVWLNPPWSAGTIDPWLERMASHDDGVALIPARIDASWFHRLVWSHISGLFIPRGRIKFIAPEMARFAQNQGKSACPCVLVSYGERCREWLEVVTLPGHFVPMEPKIVELPLFPSLT